MKLYGSLASPYVRLCRLAADARGVAVDFRVTNPLEDEAFRRVNPLGKVPALVLEDGTLLPDSGVILRCLDERGDQPSLYTRGGLARHETDALVSLSVGVLDLGVAWLLEHRRPEAERSESWQARRREGMAAGLRAMDEAARGLPEDAGLADLAFAAACDWLAFRQPEVDWRSREALTARVDRELATERFRATDPRG